MAGQDGIRRGRALWVGTAWGSGLVQEIGIELNLAARNQKTRRGWGLVGRRAGVTGRPLGPVF